MNYLKTFLRIPRRNLFSKKRKFYGNYSVVKPGNISETLIIPDFIQKPNYYKAGEPLPGPKGIEIKNEEQIEKMRQSCKLAAKVLKEVEEIIKVGVTTDQIDIFIHNLIIKNNAYPSPLYYKGFPKSVCTSVNNVACHGIPDDRPLENGDIINVDTTVFLNGHHGDNSKTFLVGEVDEAGKHLVDTTKLCLEKAIEVCGPGQHFNAIGFIIEETANKLKFSVIPHFIGHGIGSYFHGLPDILHYENYSTGRMLPGMTFTIEPILTPGSFDIEILKDNWTAVTLDGARTAQFEHTVLITENGCEILTMYL